MSERPKHFDEYLERYNFIKNHPEYKTNDMDLAIIMVVEFQLAIEKGNKHYHPVTNSYLDNLSSILKCLHECGRVEVRKELRTDELVPV